MAMTCAGQGEAGERRARGGGGKPVACERWSAARRANNDRDSWDSALCRWPCGEPAWIDRAVWTTLRRSTGEDPCDDRDRRRR